MPAAGVAQSQEMEAALGLMDLRYGGSGGGAHLPSSSRLKFYKLDVHQPEKLQDVTNVTLPFSPIANSDSKPILNTMKNGASTPKPVEMSNGDFGYLHKKYQQERRRWSELKKTIEPKVRHTEVGTQTEEEFPQVMKLKHQVATLTATIESLQEELNERVKTMVLLADVCKRCNKELSEADGLEYRRPRTMTETSSVPIEDSIMDIKAEVVECMEFSEADVSDDPEYKPKKLCRNVTPNTDLVPIGKGKAAVPARLLKQIDWNSYTNATRKLLTAVFPRRVLATHSLTGKPSPAFPNKPAKKRLDPALVKDIVETVAERCQVNENVIRMSITTKCADESKMFRSRQKNRRNNRFSRKENISPYSSNDES